MQILSPFSDIQLLGQKGVDNRKDTARHKCFDNQTQSPEALGEHIHFSDYKTLPKHMVFMIEENILTGITN